MLFARILELPLYKRRLPGSSLRPPAPRSKSRDEHHPLHHTQDVACLTGDPYAFQKAVSAVSMLGSWVSARFNLNLALSARPDLLDL